MSYQSNNFPDIAFTGIAQQTKFTHDVSLLVTAEAKKLSKCSSVPKRAFTAILSYLSHQSHHQGEVCKLEFMDNMLRRQLFSHEIQVLSWKIIHGHKWRNHKIVDSRCIFQCNEIVKSRFRLVLSQLKNWKKYSVKSMHVLHRVVFKLKLRMTKTKFDTRISKLERTERELVASKMRGQFASRIKGMAKK